MAERGNDKGREKLKGRAKNYQNIFFPKCTPYYFFNKFGTKKLWTTTNTPIAETF